MARHGGGLRDGPSHLEQPRDPVVPQDPICASSSAANSPHGPAAMTIGRIAGRCGAWATKRERWPGQRFPAPGANLEMVWSAPTTDARLMERIVRTLIQERGSTDRRQPLPNTPSAVPVDLPPLLFTM
jgi:hypothetical protein